MKTEYLIERIDECKNNPENSSTPKADDHIQSRFSMSTILSFKIIENKHDVYRGRDCTEKFCESLREEAVKIIKFKGEATNLLKKRTAWII